VPSSACENCNRASGDAQDVVLSGNVQMLCRPCRTIYHAGIADSIEGVLATTDIDRILKIRDMVNRRVRELTPLSDKFAVRSFPRDKQIQVLSAVRWYTGLDLKGGYDLIQKGVFEFVALKNTEKLLEEFRALGCVIEAIE